MLHVQFFITLFHKLLLSDVHAREQKRLIFAKNTACDSIPVFLSELTLCEICAEDSGKSLIEARVDNIIDARNGKLIYDFKTVSYDIASVFAWVVIIVTFSIVFEKTAKYFLGRLANEFKNQ